MKLLREGDRGDGVCRSCRELVDTEYQRRSVYLEESEIEVDDVLVGVCTQCGETATIPAQSTPRLKEAREGKEQVLQARIPKHLDDALHLIAGRYGASESTFSPALVRFYLHEIAVSPRFAQRVARLSYSDLLEGGSTKRRSFRLSERLYERAWTRARDVGIRSRSAMVKAAVLAAMEDLLEPSSATARRRKVEGIATAS